MSQILLFEIIFAVSFLGAIFIFLRNLPLVAEYQPKYVPKEKRVFFRLKRKAAEKKIQTTHRTHKIREKIIQKIRIIILKIDNFLLSYFQKLRERRMHIEKIYFQKKEERRKRKLERIKKLGL